MSLFSWIEDLVEDVRSMLSGTSEDLNNEALQKLEDSHRKLTEVWTEDGAPPAEYQQKLNAIVQDATQLTQIIDKLQASIAAASEVVREGDKNIKNQVDSLDQSFRDI